MILTTGPKVFALKPFEEKNPGNNLSTIVDGKHGGIWLPLAAAHPGRLDEMCGSNRRSPDTGKLVGTQRIQSAEGADNFKSLDVLGMLNQPNASADDAQRDEVILCLRLQPQP